MRCLKNSFCFIGLCMVLQVSCSKTTNNAGAVNVYVAGYENRGKLITARYWKNGQSIMLPLSQNESEANAVFLSGNDVYIAGSEDDQILNPKAKYWKNGEDRPFTVSHIIPGPTPS